MLFFVFLYNNQAAFSESWFNLRSVVIVSQQQVVPWSLKEPKLIWGKTISLDYPKKIAALLGYEDYNLYTGHCWRRTTATMAAASGMTLPQIKQITGHRSIIVWSIYYYFIVVAWYELLILLVFNVFAYLFIIICPQQ